MKKIILRIDLAYVFSLWIFIGQIIAYSISNGLLIEFGDFLFVNFGIYVPSINRMDKVVFFDNFAAKRFASIILSLMPFLFAVLLFANVENSISQVRKNKKETSVAWVFFAVGCLAFVSGLNFSGPGGVFRNSIYGFGFLATVVTFLSAYCFRIVFCIAFNK